ncbi:hypothetical protein LINPERPRIM_LOCUS25002 [Linum perenne]
MLGKLLLVCQCGYLGCYPNIKFLSTTTYLDHQHTTIVCQYRRLLERNWKVTLKHIYREANHFADVLANKGHGIDLGTHTVKCTDSIIKH